MDINHRVQKCTALSKNIRKQVLHMTHNANASHIGSCFSVADILAVLYGDVVTICPGNLKDPNRDKVILSKAHAAAALYATFYEIHVIPQEYLTNYCKDHAKLGGHVTANVPGVELSAGALGHGLAVGCGMAISAKYRKSGERIFVILGDGECNEGSIWETAMFAPNHNLDNLTVIVDYNKIQSFGTVDEVMNLEPFKEKWEAFGWATVEVDGHNIEQLITTLNSVPFVKPVPSCIIAHTVKGKGVSFMENKLEWHYKSPDGRQLNQGLMELGE